MPQQGVYEKIRALLEEAMSMEHAACEGYALLADSPDNPETRNLFQKFSAMEALHYRQLRKKYLVYGGHPDWAPASTGREFVDRMGLEGMARQAILSVCQTMEQSHADFYSSRRRSVVDPTLKEFFHHLADQEQQHVLDLQRLLDG